MESSRTGLVPLRIQILNDTGGMFTYFLRNTKAFPSCSYKIIKMSKIVHTLCSEMWWVRFFRVYAHEVDAAMTFLLDDYHDAVFKGD